MVMLALRIWLFGQFELVWGDAPLSVPQSSAARSLLAYLVVHHDRAIPRDRLTGIFWPERPDPSARRALSQALWQIRQSLRPAAGRLVTERDAVTFVLHPGDWLDVEEFEEKVHRDTKSTQVDRYTSAVALYRADFLQDTYDDWALLERERLRELYLGTLECLITLGKQRGNYEQALTCAQRLAAADPLREAAHRELMRLYYLLDRPRAALEQFASLRNLLAEELRVLPASATVSLYQEIATALEEADSPHLPIAPLPPPLLHDLAHLPFVGRANERAALLYALQTAAQGQGGLTLVEGDAGVGKTRLVNEIIADAQWRGFQVGLGKADPLAAAAPYQLLRDALSPLLTPLRIAQLAELVEPLWLSAVIPLFPAMAEHLPDLAPLAPLEPHEEQQRLWEGFARCLAGLASISPLLLVLDDLHWADEATLTALSHLAPHLRANRILLVLTCRTAEARERPAVWETLEALDRDLPLLRSRLLPLEHADAVALVQRALGTGETDTQATIFARRLLDETGGNALFLVETLKSLLEQETLTSSPDGGWVFPSGDLPLPIPASVQELAGARLARLYPALRVVLELVAVLGEEADFPVLSHASDAEPAALISALEELGRRGFLVETEARYCFEHDRIQEIVYQVIAPQRQRTLHRQAGAVLERLHPERIELLAHHFSLGEVWDRAADYNRQAGDRAKAVYAGVEAIGYYDRALEAWGHLRSPNESLGLGLYQERGRICQETGRFDQAEADFQAAYDLAGQVGDTVGQARILNLMSYLQFQRGDFGGAAAIVQQALNVATAAGLPSEIATGLFNKANATRNLGHYQAAIDLYEQASVIFERLDDQVRLADCLNRMGAAFYHIGAFARAQSLVERSLTIRRQLDDKVGISYSLINLALLYYYLGQFDHFRDAAQEALEIASAIGDPYGEDAALHDLGLAALEQGSPHHATLFFQQALGITREIGDRALEPEILTELARAYHRLGDLDKARETLEQSLSKMSISVEQNYFPCLYAYSALLFLAEDEGEMALAHARAGLREAEERKDLWASGLTNRVVGEVIGHLGDEKAGKKPVFHFEESIRILREIGAQAELARSLAAYGRYLNCSANADEIQRGTTLLDEAGTLFQQLGMAGDLARLEAETVAHLQPGRIKVCLPRADVPTGRPLRDDEYVAVTWTLAAPEDDEVSGKAWPEQSRRVARRRHRFLRLLRQAQEQGAAPTLDDLAAALEVSRATIKRDLAALRQAGHAVQTRGSRRVGNQ